MQEFTISQEGIKEIKKQTLYRSIPITLIAVGVGIAMSQARVQFDSGSWMVLIPVFCILIVISAIISKRRIDSIFSKYIVRVSGDSITREQGLTPPITLSQSEIKEIIKNKNGSFTIKAANAAYTIGIPAQIDNYQQLESELHQIKPVIEKSQQSLIERFGSLIGIAMVGLMAVVFMAENKIAVGISGTLITGFMIWSLYQININKSIDRKTKKGSYVAIIVILAVAGTTISKLLQ